MPLDDYQPHYGFLRPIIPEVVNKFLDCGDMERGFARVRCDHCKHEYLLAFSCKGRWFCPSCHQKKVQIAHECLVEYMRTTLRLPEGHPGIVMAIHTFGDYLDFHPHLHALVADGLFTRDGKFHVMAEVTLKPLEELFRARIIAFLVKKGPLPTERARMLHYPQPVLH